MKKINGIEVYSNEINDQEKNVKFFGFVRNNNDGSKSCCGCVSNDWNLMTFNSGKSADGSKTTFIINDYTGPLVLKMLYTFETIPNLFEYIKGKIEKSVELDDQQIKAIMSRIGNVMPVWEIEKFNDPSDVFSQMEQGKELFEIVGDARNYSHHHEAELAEPVFEDYIEKTK